MQLDFNVIIVQKWGKDTYLATVTAAQPSQTKSRKKMSRFCPAQQVDRFCLSRVIRILCHHVVITQGPHRERGSQAILTGRKSQIGADRQRFTTGGYRKNGRRRRRNECKWRSLGGCQPTEEYEEGWEQKLRRSSSSSYLCCWRFVWACEIKSRRHVNAQSEQNEASG